MSSTPDWQAVPAQTDVKDLGRVGRHAQFVGAPAYYDRICISTATRLGKGDVVVGA
jgi:hypothetical protein